MALACGPKLLIADEPTTALDVTVQARILDLIATLGEESGMAVLLVSHDLAVIARHCRDVLVMYGGGVMESGPADAVLRRPLHPYTRALMAARPQLGAERGSRLQAISGSAAALGAGCPFAPRCPVALPVCSEAPPPVVSLPNGHTIACVRVTPDGRFE
jgi:peptide/nickel transport system ATP-binding protein